MRHAKRTAAWLAAASFTLAGVLLATPQGTSAQAQPAAISRASVRTAHAGSYAPSRLATYMARYREAAARSAARVQARRARQVPAAVAVPGGYADPLRDAAGLTVGRIDMGADFGGTGPVYALGPGVITDTYNSGWGPPYGASPGGFICELLTSGPDAEQYVYVAEGITASVSVGQRVTSLTVIGVMNGNGIETGWAAPPGAGAALGAPGFDGHDPTAAGESYSALLKSLGTP